VIAVLSRGLLFLVLLWFAGFVWFVLTLPGPAPDMLKTDGIVVLTGGPGRVSRGIDLLRRGQTKRLLISGVGTTVRPAELAAEHDVPVRLFDCCIDLGKRAADTRGNGEEIAEWARFHRYKSVRIVTSQSHMARALLEARSRLGPGVRIAPDAVASALSFGPIATEYSKFAFRRLTVAVERGTE
jgi:uncharacterized SAM-binding protein YcdF (DUF218 family)